MFVSQGLAPPSPSYPLKTMAPPWPSSPDFHVGPWVSFQNEVAFGPTCRVAFVCPSLLLLFPVFDLHVLHLAVTRDVPFFLAFSAALAVVDRAITLILDMPRFVAPVADV